MTRTIGLFLFLLTLAFTAPALAGDSACEGGRYLLDQGLPFLDEPAIVVVRGDQVSLQSGILEVCGAPDESRVRRRGNRVLVRARWGSCGQEAGKVRLRLRTSRGCETATGRVRSKRPRSRTRFTATRSCQYAPVVDCAPGYGAADVDGDGCSESCEPIPGVCPEALCTPGYEPVDANGDGCFESCEVSTSACFSDAECSAPASYCARGLGMCSGPGECRPPRVRCTREGFPVCGCDGVTYANPCFAETAGRNVAFEGACEVSATACSSDAECTAPGSYCSRPAGSCGGPGTCAPRAEVCPEVFAPVCGCDGVTYSNSCFATGAGSNVVRDGACPP